MSGAARRGARARVARLFWKFFALIVIVQMGSILLVGAWLYQSRHQDGEIDGHARPAATVTIERAPPFLPPEPFIGGLLASLGSATLLAWLLSKPIRSLQSALGEAAGGNLYVRVADRMGGGNDELRDLGAEFDRMLSRLRTLIVAQRQLLKDVSHEMRSPVARIQAAVGLIQQQPEQLPAMLARIERESVRIDRLLGELLALSRLQADVDSQLGEDIDLRELLAEIVDDARFEAAASGRELMESIPLDGIVRGNVELLRRAIENVVRNAIKYSHRGGRIEVGVARGAPRQAVLISVRDYGSGVPEGELGSIFEPFFRSPTHADKEGTGLGLAIARRIIESHGGSIEAHNAPGGGLRVAITLPLLAAADAGALPSEHARERVVLAHEVMQ